jgi:protein quaking
MIRGQGSLRNKEKVVSYIPIADSEKEQQKKGKAGWEHLDEPLHVIVQVEKEEPAASESLQKAVDIVEKLLVPVLVQLTF